MMKYNAKGAEMPLLAFAVWVWYDGGRADPPVHDNKVWISATATNAVYFSLRIIGADGQIVYHPSSNTASLSYEFTVPAAGTYFYP